ncbi:type 1 fimbrial protein [Salmonella enterica subsp. enterica serovar Carrau]|uniref:fimbrial protein n=1 Tax=Salmonella enterica TaxID=28901 RepID=UPI001D1E46E1|nr:fimbrial protein [Salmonella enterica]EAZ1417769.1 type 1 fimbrial protein [Salmonella enterica]EBC3428291.1 type 1 fimbrial protein [Salmonella enterica]MCT7004484.1 type 1 fimbrial protein [Salmonella enterica subsp. enterica serovar Carrau]
MNNAMKLLAIAVLSAAGMSAASAATNGTLTITGNVVDQTCEVDAAQLTRTVDLGEITQGNIMAVAQNASVSHKPLVFDVTNCPASATGVGIKFEYTTDATNTQYLENTGNGKGVLLGITDDADALVAPGSVVNAANLDTTAGKATVNAKVQAYRTAAADTDVTAGNIASTATVTVVMN